MALNTEGIENIREWFLHDIIKTNKEKGPVERIMICKTCAYLAAVRKMETLPMTCPVCKTSAPPVKLWLELVVK